MSTQARKALDKLATLHAETLNAIEEHVKACDDKALDQLTRATIGLSTTNCWYAAYEIREPVLNAIRRERYLRRTRITAPADTPGAAQ